MGTRASAPLVLNLGTKHRPVFNFTHRPLYPQWKNPSIHWSRNLYGLQNRYVHFVGKYLAPVGIRASNHSGSRLVALSTKQYQLIKINLRAMRLHSTKVPSIYQESHHDLKKKSLLGIKCGLPFSPPLLHRIFTATIKKSAKIGSRQA